MAAEPLRRHIRHEPCSGDRLFTRRLVPRPTIPVSAPAESTLRPSFFASDKYFHFFLNGGCSAWTCLGGANDDDDDEGFCAHHLPILTPPPCVRPLFRPPTAQEEEKARGCGPVAPPERGVRPYRFPLHRGTARDGGQVEHDSQERADLVRLVFFASSTAHLISPVGSKTNGSRCATPTASQPFEHPDRITRPAPNAVDRLGPDPSPRPCRPAQFLPTAQTLNRQPTTLRPPPTPTSRYHARRSLNKAPRGIMLGLRVVIGRISTTVMTEAVQSVIESDILSRWSIPLVRCKNNTLSKFSFLSTFTPVCSAALHLFSTYLLLFVS